VTADIDNLMSTFSAKLEFFKKRNENQRLAILSYNKEIKARQIALKRLKEEQFNLNRKLQNEIINSKWVLENMSKFDEVTNETLLDSSNNNSNSNNSNNSSPIAVINESNTTQNSMTLPSQILSQQNSQQQIMSPPSVPTKEPSNASLSGNKNDSKNSLPLNQDNSANNDNK